MKADDPGDEGSNMTNRYHDDPRDDKPFWSRESMSRLVAPSPGSRRWSVWLLPGLCAALLLALIISVSVSNSRAERRFLAVETTVANLTSGVQTALSILQTRQQHDAEVQKEISRLKFTMATAKEQLDSVSEAVEGVDVVESLRHAVAGLKCSLNKALHNDTADCCPLDWVAAAEGCYLFSSSGLAWRDARDYCSSQHAALAMLKTPEEWAFVTSRTKPLYFWVGLSDERTGDWEWVDGSRYTMDRSQWKPGQPDNWEGHGLGGTEDCAHLHSNGQLNDDHCTRKYRYVCQGHGLT